MSDTYIFDKREKSEEAHFKMSEELAFKIQACQCKLFAQWIVDFLNLPEEDATCYIRDLIMLGIDVDGPEKIFMLAMKDLRKAGIYKDIKELRTRFCELYHKASHDVAEKFPEALGKDHAQVGG